MRCSSCGKSVQDDARYCPYCGGQLLRRRNPFKDIFSLMGREMGRMDRQMQERQKMEKSFEARDISQFFRAPGARGFKIKIVQRGGEEPRISVNTTGNVNPGELEKQINEQLKAFGPIKIKFSRAPQGMAPAPGKLVQKARPAGPPPKVTEEPKTDVRRVGTKVVVKMDLPGVKAEGDIEVKDLPQSVEVKARAGDKAYFKILTKPGQARLASKVFKKGELVLEFS